MVYCSLEKSEDSMKKLTTLFIILMAQLSLVAQGDKDKISQYINTYKAIAIAEMQRSGVPASIKLAQGILETAAGESELVKKSNNHFGIKCKNDWTGETAYHDDDAKGECFRKYSTAADSYADHSDFLKTRPHYAFLFTLDPLDYEGWAKGLKKAGYATNPAYPQRLIKIIVEHNLQQFTLAALQKNNGEKQPIAEATAAAETPIATIESTPQTIIPEEPPTETAAIDSILTTPGDTPKPIVSKYPNGVFSINGTKVLYANAGTSLLALANKNRISYKNILEFNHLDNIDILPKAQLVFLGRKAKKGAAEFHVVQENETLLDISQINGVRIENLVEYNRISKGMEPAVGEKIYLKSNAPILPKLVNVGTNQSNSNRLK
jgi:LysM repeat protein